MSQNLLNVSYVIIGTKERLSRVKSYQIEEGAECLLCPFQSLQNLPSLIDSKIADKRLVKRIVGLPGDTIYMQNNALVINGISADYDVLEENERDIIIEEHLPERTHQVRLSNGLLNRHGRNYGPTSVPADSYFVLGDNRDNSADSRVYSFIPRGEIIGRSSSVIFSLDSSNKYFPRGDRFLSELK